MKIDFNTVITDFAGNSVKIQGTKKDLTLGFLSVTVLSANDDELSVEDKFKRGALAQEIFESEVDLASEEITLLKDLIGKAYGPLFTYKCHEILDPKA